MSNISFVFACQHNDLFTFFFSLYTAHNFYDITKCISQYLDTHIWKPKSKKYKKTVITMLYLINIFSVNVDAARSLHKPKYIQYNVNSRFIVSLVQTSSIILFQKIKITKPKIFKIKIPYKETPMLTFCSSNNIAPINWDAPLNTKKCC